MTVFHFFDEQRMHPSIAFTKLKRILLMMLIIQCCQTNGFFRFQQFSVFIERHVIDMMKQVKIISRPADSATL